MLLRLPSFQYRMKWRGKRGKKQMTSYIFNVLNYRFKFAKEVVSVRAGRRVLGGSGMLLKAGEENVLMSFGGGGSSGVTIVRKAVKGVPTVSAQHQQQQHQHQQQQDVYGVNGGAFGGMAFDNRGVYLNGVEGTNGGDQRRVWKASY